MFWALFVTVSATVLLMCLTLYNLALYGAERLQRRQRIHAAVGGGVLGRRSSLLKLGDRVDQSEWGKRTQERLQAAGLNLKPSEYGALLVLICFVIFALMTSLGGLHPIVSLVSVGLFGRLAPALYFRQTQRRYVTLFEAQLADVAALMGNSLRAGLSVPQAIRLVGQEIPRPAGPEFARLEKEISLGAGLEDASEAMLRRLPSRELQMMVNAITVQRVAGGNLAQTLSGIADTMRERQRLHAELGTLTAEARFSALIIPLLPVGMLLLLRNAMSGFIDPLFTHPIGWVVLGLFGAAQVFAYLVIRRIADIKV